MLSPQQVANLRKQLDQLSREFAELVDKRHGPGLTKLEEARYHILVRHRRKIADLVCPIDTTVSDHIMEVLVQNGVYRPGYRALQPGSRETETHDTQSTESI